jgi:hypothetical protein
VSDLCRARNNEADTVCSRRAGHDGHHCDATERCAWDDTELLFNCPNLPPHQYDHGQPPSRAARRGNKVHPRSAKDRADYRPGSVRPL